MIKNAEEAVNYYVSIFRDAMPPASESKVLSISRYGESGAKVSGMPEGSVMVISFKLAGQEFIALNGGPVFKFTEAVSFVINCETQEELDYFWEKLSAGGDPKSQQCGWLKDRYGLSWQITPTVLDELMQDKDAEKVERVMKAMIEMKKIDIQELKRAYEE